MKISSLRLYAWNGYRLYIKPRSCLLPSVMLMLPFRLPAKIGGNLPGVHYIRDVADADSLVSSLVCPVNK